MIKMMKINKMKKKKNLKRVKINLKIRIKNLISLSFKMITKTSKELEKYVSMMKRYNNTQKEKVICKSKEIRLTIK